MAAASSSTDSPSSTWRVLKIGGASGPALGDGHGRPVDRNACSPSDQGRRWLRRRRLRTPPRAHGAFLRSEEHPVQRSATDTVAQWTGMPAPRLIKAVDGCGVVVYGLPLEHMARS